MPIPIFQQIVTEGFASIPYLPEALRLAPWLLLVYLLRWFFAGRQNKFDRIMHGKVVMVTGGTSGLGAAIVDDLASRGAQIILLVRSTHDSWLVDYVADLRLKHNNSLIYAEECDLSSLHSIRVFCTKWLDNAPPRRLDSVVLAAGVMAPPFSQRVLTKDGVEHHWGINYLANFHFLTLMMPALKVQPPDRDVRVLVATCSAYMLGDLDLNDPEFLQRGYPSRRPWLVYGAAKLALMSFLVEMQRQLNEYKRPDNAPMNVRVYSVDPGMLRSPGSRRWISFGSVFGLFVYMITWPLWWLVLKSTDEGAQSFFAGLYDPEYASTQGGALIRECQTSSFRKADIESDILGQQLYQISREQVDYLEKKSAAARAKDKKQTEEKSEGIQKTETGKEKKSKSKKVAFSDDAPENSTADDTKKKPGRRRTKKT